MVIGEWGMGNGDWENFHLSLPFTLKYPDIPVTSHRYPNPQIIVSDSAKLMNGSSKLLAYQ
jgi:hypothetical protein